MRAILVITLAVAVVAANRFNVHNDNNNNGYNTGNNVNNRQLTYSSKNRQIFILNLVSHLTDDVTRKMWTTEYRPYWQMIELDSSNYRDHRKVFTFMTLFQNGWFQQRNQAFSLLNERNVITTKVAFDFFDTMVNWNTVAKNLVFCRRHLNEYQFWYLLTLLVQHNQFMENLVLPPAYEVLPSQFFTADVLTMGIQMAINAKINTNNKVIVMQNYTNGLLGSYDDDDNDNVNDLNKIQRKITDWNTLVQVARNLQRDLQLKNQQVVQNINRANKDIKTVVNNNGRQQNQGKMFGNNGEDKLNYFTEDIGLNNYFYFSRMDNSRIVNDIQMYKNNNSKAKFNKLSGNAINVREFNDKINRRGERYLYQMQQLIARFNLERISNKMDNVKAIDLDNDVQNGVFSNLRLTNGLQVENRQNNMKLNTDKNKKLVDAIKDFETRYYQAIDQGFVQAQNGNKIGLHGKDGINILGNLLQDNQYNINFQFFRNLEMYYRQLMGGNYVSNMDHSDNRFTTTVMGTHETTLRDPVFWQIMKRVTNIVNTYKGKLTSYTKNDVEFKGVQIKKVKVDKMITTFKYFDADVTNAFNENLIQMCWTNARENNNGNNKYDNNFSGSSSSSSSSSDSSSSEEYNKPNNNNNNWNNINRGNNQYNGNSNSDSSSSSDSSSGSDSNEYNNGNNYNGNSKNTLMTYLYRFMNTKILNKNGMYQIVDNLIDQVKSNTLNEQNLNQLANKFASSCNFVNNFCNKGRSFNARNIIGNNYKKNNNYNNNYNGNNKDMLLKKLYQNMNTYNLDKIVMYQIVDYLIDQVKSNTLNEQNLNQLANKFASSCNFGNNFCNKGRNFNARSIIGNTNYGTSVNNQYTAYMNVMGGNNNQNRYQIITRQRRLTTNPFTITMSVTSNTNQVGIVRIFLGPRVGNRQQLNENRLNFVEIDQFIVGLKQGQNTIQRNSIDFKNVVDDPLTFGKLFQRTINMYENTNKGNNDGNENNMNRYNVNYDTVNNNNGFPHRLILPKGVEGGQEYTLFVVVNDLDQTNGNDVKYWNNKNWNNFVKGTNNGNNNNVNSGSDSDSDSSSSSTQDSSSSGSDSNENTGTTNYRNWNNNNNWNKNQNSNVNNKNQFYGMVNQINNGKNNLWCNHQGVKIYNCNDGNKNIGNGNGVLDNRAMGFPLDRNIMVAGAFIVENMYFKDVTVFHKDTSNKY